MKRRIGLVLVFLFFLGLFSAQARAAQDSIPVIERLKLDTSYANVDCP